ncbi:glycosyltransferase [Natronolimnobius sp. AArcel1]|uniref:glycosyltransferase family 2 protein n=1 Tax=Natronolimnobius sp. AArcel1 TaxID=1679093 RepID=UPI0013E9D16D|nr:glycosyltransferase family 2 protein [Natronolimnobius sp. AArcel1]NGM71241.1 glycosyltransferase [Natronolimnobius sp. AArcel1]
MYNDKTIGVVVTAYNEEAFVGNVIETVPAYVDRIYAVDDASPDGSWSVIQRVADQLNEEATPEPAVALTDGGDDRRVVPIQHDENRGYGAAVKTGYKRAAEDGIDVVAVLNGDGQMDPEIMDRIIDPVVTGEADYAKGNRLLTADDRDGMSSFRLFGNAMLTGLSKFASGYWTVGDPQNGYTAISSETIEELDLESITDQYGFLNHILTHLNVNERRVADVSMSAVYGDEESSIKYTSFIRYVSMLLLRSFCWRLNRRYVVEGFNPAVVFYGAGSAGLAGGVAGAITSIARGLRGKEGFTGLLASFVALLLGVVSLGVAIAMDAAENENLETTSYETTAETANGATASSAPADSNAATAVGQDSSQEPSHVVSHPETGNGTSTNTDPDAGTNPSAT